MKNTLFFDDSFEPVLLKNEEADAVGMRNAIFLHFTTTASANQKLQITVRGQLNEIALSASHEYDFQLTGEYWASGSTTSLRIVNDDLVSEYTYINYPEIIQIDAALQEQDVENREYYLQGKEDQIDELKTTLLIYKNGGEYNITALAKIAEFYFLSKNDDAGALLTLTMTVICSGITTTDELEVHFRVNNTFDDVFVPTETVENNKYIITITYPVEGISSNLNNHVEIYMKLGEGNGQILQGGAIATLTASGIVNAAPEPWDGTLQILQHVTPQTIPSPAMTILPVTDAANVETQQPISDRVTETIAAIITAVGAITIPALTETAIVGRKTTRLEIVPERAAEYTFNTTYVNATGSAFALRLDYDYIGTPGTIDSGYLTSTEIPLDVFAAVTSVTVTEVTA